jgi:hypothetical protein
MLHRVSALLVFLGLSACATIVPPPASTVAGRDPQEAWASVLERYVDDQGRVDFQGVAADRGDLDTYVAWVARVSPASNPELFPTQADRNAYYLNSYNALAMYNVIDAGIPETLEGLRKVPFFFFRKVEIGGERMSLATYENETIRKLGDPRVHFALNCMAAGCPRLPREPFTAAGLDAELDREAREFFAEPRNLVVEPERQAFRVSEILSFFTGDFLAVAPSLPAYINRYRDGSPIPDGYKAEFIDYDWRVNNQPKNLGPATAALVP